LAVDCRRSDVCGGRGWFCAEFGHDGAEEKAGGVGVEECAEGIDG
jgi:hypothetical protein